MQSRKIIEIHMRAGILLEKSSTDINVLKYSTWSHVHVPGPVIINYRWGNCISINWSSQENPQAQKKDF